MNGFADKVAIVTGAGSGIGAALAKELASRGARVVAADVAPERAEQTRAAIAASGGAVQAVTIDVTDADAVKKMVDAAVAEHGRLDLIFNNAGIAVAGQARDVSLADWHAVLDVNLFGVINGVHAAYPIMVKQGFGHIVNTGSVEGLVPVPGTISYVASKYAVVGLSNTLRIEGAEHGVKVSVVCPGFIRTRIFRDCKKVNLNVDEQVEKIETSRFVTTPEECAKVVLRGVERNKAIIPVSALAWFLWFTARLSPGLAFFLIKQINQRTMADKRVDNC